MFEYKVLPVVCDYGVYENDKMIVICNSHYNANLISEILSFDSEFGVPFCLSKDEVDGHDF